MAGTTPRTIRLQDLTVDVSLSGVAQGDLLFRGASKWNNLAAGTSGYYLKSNGAGADPSWASVSVSPAGSSGQLQWNSSSSFAGAAYLNYATSGSILTITDGATTDVPLVVNGVTSQSGDLAQFKVNGSSLVAVKSTGSILPAVDNSITLGTASFRWNAISTVIANTSQVVDNSGGNYFKWSGTAFTFANNMMVGFSSTTSYAGTVDVGFYRNSAGVVEINNGSNGTYRDLKLRAVEMVDGNLILGTTTGTKIGTATGQKLAFWNATPVVQQVLATGAGAAVDDVISLLQTLGLCKQS